MRLLPWLLCACLAAVSAQTHNITKREASAKRVVCYYTNWSVYRPGTAKFSPQNINPYLCTHLIYAFGGLSRENGLRPYDKYQDIEQGGYAKFTGLKTYNKQLKTMLAIGGWNEGSTRFSPLVADQERRREFVRNVLKFLRQNHFDGLDLDWEYPAFRDGGKARDRANYALLVQELREEFNRESQKTGRPRLLLTMAVPAGIEYIDKGYDIPKLNRYLDFMNILSYDYHSAFEPSVNHHSPLYPLEEESEYNFDTQLSIDYTIKHYLKLGADRDKLVMGIPTYGRSYTLYNSLATEIGAPADGPGEQGDATREKGYLAYYEICENLKTNEWKVEQPNPKAMGPYAYKGNQWVGYDDEDIVKKKAHYVNDNGLGGIMFWAIDNDDFRGRCHGRPYPLIESAKEAMLSTRSSFNDVVPSQGTRRRPTTSNRPHKRRPSANKNKQRSTVLTTTTTTTTPKYIYPTATPEPPTTPDPGSDFKCEDEGFFPHPRDCKKYFWCLDSGPSNLGIVAHQFTCPSGLVFNKAADSCDYTRNVICNNKKKSSDTTTRAPPITAATSRTTGFRTTSTSTTTSTTTTPEPPEEEYEEYEDEEEEGSEVDQEDPQAIKDLINLIKKLGGVEQLEKQFHLHDTAPERGSGAPSSGFSKSLYDRVLSRNTDRLHNLNNERGRSNDPGPSRQNYRGASTTKSPDTKRYTSQFRNGPVGPQNAGLDHLEEVTSLRREKPQYVTIQRARPSTQAPEEEDEDDEDVEDEDVSDEEEDKGADERSPKFAGPEYVTIRRARPSTALNADNTTPKYITIQRQRPTREPEIEEISSFEEQSPDPTLNPVAEEPITIQTPTTTHRRRKQNLAVEINSKEIVSIPTDVEQEEVEKSSETPKVSGRKEYVELVRRFGDPSPNQPEDDATPFIQLASEEANVETSGRFNNVLVTEEPEVSPKNPVYIDITRHEAEATTTDANERSETSSTINAFVDTLPTTTPKYINLNRRRGSTSTTTEPITTIVDNDFQPISTSPNYAYLTRKRGRTSTVDTIVDTTTPPTSPPRPKFNYPHRRRGTTPTKSEPTTTQSVVDTTPPDSVIYSIPTRRRGTTSTVLQPDATFVNMDLPPTTPPSPESFLDSNLNSGRSTTSTIAEPIGTTSYAETAYPSTTSFNLDNLKVVEKPVNVDVSNNFVETVTALNALQTDLTTPNVMQTDVTPPNVMQTDLTTPNVMESDLTTPNVMESDLTTPNIMQNDLTTLNIIQFDLTTPNVLQTDVTTPNVMQTDVTTPNVMQTDVTTPNAMQKDLTTPNVMQTDLTTQNVFQTDLTTPNVLQTDLTTPNVLQTDLTTPVVLQTEFTTPNIFETDLTTQNGLQADNSISRIQPSLFIENGDNLEVQTIPSDLTNSIKKVYGAHYITKDIVNLTTASLPETTSEDSQPPYSPFEGEGITSKLSLTYPSNPTTTPFTPTVTRVVTSVTESGTTERQRIAVNRVPYRALVAALRAKQNLISGDEFSVTESSSFTSDGRLPINDYSVTETVQEGLTTQRHMERIMEVNRLTLVTLNDEYPKSLTKPVEETSKFYGNDDNHSRMTLNKISEVNRLKHVSMNEDNMDNIFSTLSPADEGTTSIVDQDQEQNIIKETHATDLIPPETSPRTDNRDPNSTQKELAKEENVTLTANTVETTSSRSFSSFNRNRRPQNRFNGRNSTGKPGNIYTRRRIRPSTAYTSTTERVNHQKITPRTPTFIPKSRGQQQRQRFRSSRVSSTTENLPEVTESTKETPAIETTNIVPTEFATDFSNELLATNTESSNGDKDNESINEVTFTSESTPTNDLLEQLSTLNTEVPSATEAVNNIRNPEYVSRTTGEWPDNSTTEFTNETTSELAPFDESIDKSTTARHLPTTRGQRFKFSNSRRTSTSTTELPNNKSDSETNSESFTDVVKKEIKNVVRTRGERFKFNRRRTTSTETPEDETTSRADLELSTEVVNKRRKPVVRTRDERLKFNRRRITTTTEFPEIEPLQQIHLESSTEVLNKEISNFPTTRSQRFKFNSTRLRSSTTQNAKNEETLIDAQTSNPQHILTTRGRGKFDPQLTSRTSATQNVNEEATFEIQTESLTEPTTSSELLGETDAFVNENEVIVTENNIESTTAYTETTTIYKSDDLEKETTDNEESITEHIRNVERSSIRPRKQIRITKRRRGPTVTPNETDSIVSENKDELSLVLPSLSGSQEGRGRIVHRRKYGPKPAVGNHTELILANITDTDREQSKFTLRRPIKYDADESLDTLETQRSVPTAGPSNAGYATTIDHDGRRRVKIALIRHNHEDFQREDDDGLSHNKSVSKIQKKNISNDENASSQEILQAHFSTSSQFIHGDPLNFPSEFSRTNINSEDSLTHVNNDLAVTDHVPSLQGVSTDRTATSHRGHARKVVRRRRPSHVSSTEQDSQVTRGEPTSTTTRPSLRRPGTYTNARLRQRGTTSTTTPATSALEASHRPKPGTRVVRRRKYTPRSANATTTELPASDDSQLETGVSVSPVQNRNKFSFPRRRTSTTTSTTAASVTDAQEEPSLLVEDTQQLEQDRAESETDRIPDLANAAVVAIHNLATRPDTTQQSTVPAPLKVPRFFTTTPRQILVTTSRVEAPRGEVLKGELPRVARLEVPRVVEVVREEVSRRPPSNIRQRPFSKVTTTKVNHNSGSTSRAPVPLIVDYEYYDDEGGILDTAPQANKVKIHTDGYIECLDQGNFPHPYSCKKFISCAKMENGDLLGWEYTCPRQLSFDPIGGICNWSAGLGCKE